MERDNFVFFASWIDVLGDMTNEEKLEYLWSIIKYGLSGEMPETSRYVKGALTFVKRDIDTAQERYDAICERRREAGRKGAAKTNANRGKSQQMAANADFVETNSANNSNTQHKEKEKDKVKVKDINISSSTNVKEDLSQTSVRDAASSVNIKAFIECWNNIVVTYNSNMKPLRRIGAGTMLQQKVQARVREYGKQVVLEVMTKAAQSDFLNGRTGGNQAKVFAFDWIMCPNNFQKIYNGNYDNQQHTPTQSDKDRRYAEALAEEQRMQEEREREREKAKLNAVPWSPDYVQQYEEKQIHHNND